MSVYLSQLILNPRSRQVRQDLADCHELHRTILGGFGQAERERSSGAREQFGVLYRVEPDTRGGAVRVLVQSQAEPDWTRLQRDLPDYLHTPTDGRRNPQTKSIVAALARIAVGQELVFRLRANPTRRVHPNSTIETNDLSRWGGKRVELRTEADWLDWIERKGYAGGFELPQVTASADPISPERYLEAFESPASASQLPFDVRANKDLKVNGRKGGQHRLTFGSVLFEGRLRVTDAALFRQTLEQGIGSGKAYGFGLLSIAPADN
jgi:CRISPR system Cascade subunit CasE